jgi:glycosyltransferase involved in cell wall biosynthesis
MRPASSISKRLDPAGHRSGSERPLRVLLIAYIHGEGGIQTHTKYLAEGLRRRGHDVKIATPPPMANHGHRACPDSARADVHVYKGMLDLIRWVRASEPNVTIVTGTGWKAMSGALVTPRAGRKVFFEAMSGARRGLVDPRVLVHFGFDAVVGQGTPVTRRFAEEFGWAGRSVTIPAFPEPMERSAEIPIRLQRVPHDGVRFVHFGRLAPHKNVRLLVDRFRDFAPPGSSLDIWGSGQDGEAIASMIDAHRLGDRIVLRGPYPQGEAYIELMRSYDLKLLPTVGEEGAPLVLLEAMACGLPFVANGVGGISDYANPDCAITSGDITEFVPAVLTMVERLKQSDIDARRLQAHYRDHFSFERLVDRWEYFLAALTRSGSTRTYDRYQF